MSEPITFKYLLLPNGLGGRGGVLRFFMLAHNIPFAEDLVELSEWAPEKERMISSKENPCGAVPVVYTKVSGKDVQLSQHIATARYLARLHGVTKNNTPYDECVQDMVADEYQNFRNAWVDATFGTDEALKAKYTKEDAPKFLALFETLFAKYKTHDVYLSVSKTDNNPLWADAALFGLLRDNLITGYFSAEDLKKSYPNLAALVDAFGKIPAVKAWIDSKSG